MRTGRRTIAILLAALLGVAATLTGSEPASAATKALRLDVTTGKLELGADATLPVDGAASFFGLWNDATGTITNVQLLAEPQEYPIVVLGQNVTLLLSLTQVGPATASIDPVTGVGNITLSADLGISALPPWGALVPAGCRISSINLVVDTTTGGGVPFDVSGAAPTGGTLSGSDMSIPATSGCGTTVGTRADNLLGLPRSDASALLALAAGTAPTAPAAPGHPMAVPGDARVAVSWTTPAGAADPADVAPITGYRVRAMRRGTVAGACQTAGTTCAVENLVNGREYRFDIQAKNWVGFGPAASRKATPRTVPGTPRNVVGTSRSKAIEVSWAAPTSNGGAPITGYQAVAAPGGKVCNTTGARSCTITGLTPGTAYTVKVKAKNLVGFGPLSAKSPAVRPRR